MERYNVQQIEELKDVKNTNTYGVETEEYVRFLDYKDYYPIKVLMIGKTYPNNKYSVYREKSDISVIEYIVSGEGYVYMDGKKTRVSEGDFIYLRAGYEHIYHADKSNPYTKIWMNFNSISLDVLANTVSKKDSFIVHCPEIGNYFSNIIDMAATNRSSTSVINTIYKNVVSILLRAGDVLNIESSYSLADRVKELLDNAIYTNNNINDICHNLKYSRQQIWKVFTEKYLVTPIEYIVDKKIETAKLALQYSNNSIVKICDMLCFSSQQYFSMKFKSKTGMSPTEYKKQFEKKNNLHK